MPVVFFRNWNLKEKDDMICFIKSMSKQTKQGGSGDRDVLFGENSYGNRGDSV
jgi:hypothetical protein